MFSKVFLFFLECFGKIINVFKNFKIDTNLTYFDFLVFSAAVLLLFQLLRVVREESNEDDRFYRRMQRYDEYKKRKKEENSDADMYCLWKVWKLRGEKIWPVSSPRFTRCFPLFFPQLQHVS